MLSEKAIAGLMKASPVKRYKSFLSTVADMEEIWFLYSDKGYATLVLDGIIHVLVWPHKVFCEFFKSDEERIASMEIHEFLDMCKDLDQSVRFMVFPTSADSYIVTRDQICKDINIYLDEIE